MDSLQPRAIALASTTYIARYMGGPRLTKHVNGLPHAALLLKTPRKRLPILTMLLILGKRSFRRPPMSGLVALGLMMGKSLAQYHLGLCRALPLQRLLEDS